MRDTPKTKLILYLACTFGLSAVFYGIIIAKGFGAFGGLAVFGLMWCPAFGAVAARLATQGNLRGMGWGLGGQGLAGLRWIAAAYVLPIVAGLAVYGFVWLTGIGGFSTARMMDFPQGAPGWGGVFLGQLARLFTIGFLFSVLSAFGEELGWRGLMMPEMAKIMDFRGVSLWGGLIWAVYHYPIILFSGYHSSAPLWYGTIMFTLTVLAVSIVFAWLRLRSRSLWTGVILHATHNLVIQSVFDLLTEDRGATAWITGEFGVGLVLAYSAAALWCWKRRSSVCSQQPVRVNY
jgi:membrane protease YdiL (CAAX protease family)